MKQLVSGAELIRPGEDLSKLHKKVQGKTYLVTYLQEHFEDIAGTTNVTYCYNETS
jgi:hypothetical protein